MPTKATTSPGQPTAAPAEHRLVPLTDIKASPDNPRSVGFDDAGLADLVESIKAQGLIEPVVLRVNSEDDVKDPHPFVLVVGERRWRACMVAGQETIPAIIRWDLDRKAALELTVIENFQRQDLNPIDEARGFQSLQQVAGLTQKQIGERIGASQPVIANRLRLLELTPEVQLELQNGTLSLGQGLAMLRHVKGLTPQAINLMAYEVMDDRMTVKEIERATPGLGLMEEQGLNVYIGHEGDIGRGWKAPCQECPFNARRQTLSGAQYCFKPEHALELRTAWEAERDLVRLTALDDAKAASQAVAAGMAVAAPPAPPVEIAPETAQDDDTAAEPVEVATDSAPAPAPEPEPAENVTNLWDKLPKLEMMEWGTFERVTEYTKPEGCSEQCACRGLARAQTLDYPVPVCFDPKRYSSLKAVETKARNKAKATALQVRLDAIREVVTADRDGWIGAADLTVVAAAILRSQYTAEGAFKRAAESLGVEWPMDSYNAADHRVHAGNAESLEVINATAALGAPMILKVLMLGLFELEAKHLADFSKDPDQGWFGWYADQKQPAKGKGKKAQKESA